MSGESPVEPGTATLDQTPLRTSVRRGVLRYRGQVTRILLTPLVQDATDLAVKHGRLTATPAGGTFAQTRAWEFEPYTVPFIDLEPPAVGTAWQLTLTIGARTTIRTVIFTGTSVDWDHLTDVDPSTITPVPDDEQLAAWIAVRDQIINALDDALDLPDLTTLFENRIA